MKRTEQTLLEQMKINDVEIQHRKALLNLSDEELAMLASHKSVIEENIDELVKEFYEKQTEIDEISLLIGDVDTLHRLRSAQRTYVLDLFSGSYGSEYVNNRLRIGLVHKRIGVEPKLYLSAVLGLKTVIVKALRAAISDSDQLFLTLDALEKLTQFDTTLVFDTYIASLCEEIESAKNKSERYAASLEEKVAERTKQLEQQAKIDPLTGLYNQRAMQELFSRELALAKRRHYKLSLAYIDIDNFKNINDSQGHMAGDEVLKSIGTAMLERVRKTDVPCRYGGDEFCLILPDSDKENAELICKEIIERFVEICPGHTISVGISETGLDKFIDSDTLISMADSQMYLAKKEEGFKICA